MHDLACALVRATEDAARAVAGHIGGGDKLAIDRAATLALRDRLNRLDFAGRIVIGEGEKDHAPGLFHGERVGKQAELVCDLAVDPVDGTAQVACGGPDSLSVLAAGSPGSLFFTPVYYMKKVAAGPRIVPHLGAFGDDWVNAPVGRLVECVCRAVNREPAKVTVCLLNRPRHEALIAELRQTGCRVLLQECDVSGTVAAALPDSGIDLSVGISGAPESVLSAVALKCLGGAIQGMLVHPDGRPVDGRLLGMADLAGGAGAFVATGVTDGCLLRGVRQLGDRVVTHSLLLSTEGPSVRWLETHHGVGPL